MPTPRSLVCAALAACLALPPAARALEVSGYVDLEYRDFLHDPLDPQQHGDYLALGAEPEFYHSWNDGQDAVTLTPFLRASQYDGARDHADLREANWLHVGEGWETRVGLGKVFWGVTESQHLVDIINQTDTLEGPDGEDKLGQPMLNLILSRDWGDLSLFWLPYFRERPFAGSEGRLRTLPRVDSHQARYASDAEEAHQDFALRWSRTFDDLDVALSHFHGTSREPILQAGTDGGGNPVLIPFYPQIDQTGLEASLVQGDMLWKLEAIYRSGMTEDYFASVAGFEYTFVGAFDSDLDLGWLMEYHYDDRGRRATTPFQDDLFLGLRLTLNDVQSTEFLAGVVFDNGSSGRLGFVEASRRLGERTKLSVEARFFDRLRPTDPLFSARDDDHLLCNLAWYF